MAVCGIAVGQRLLIRFCSSSCGILGCLAHPDDHLPAGFAVAGGACLQNVTAATAHTKDKEGDLGKPSKDGEHGKARAPSDPQANVFVLRKMVEEVFTVLYSKNRAAARVLLAAAWRRGSEAHVSVCR